MRVAQFLDNSKAKFAYARYLIDLDEYAEARTQPTRGQFEWILRSFASNPDDSSVFQIRLGRLQSGAPRGSAHLE